ncbi:MAG: LCP family protein [Acidothermales bacterium]|nr:LCP family protein [Acidothermales bacterium]
MALAGNAGHGRQSGVTFSRGWGVLLNIRGVRIGPIGPRTYVALVVGLVSAAILLVSVVVWATESYAAGKVRRVDAFADMGNRPPPVLNGSVDVLFTATEAPAPKTTARRLSYVVLAHLSRRHDAAVYVDLPVDSLVTVPAHRDAHGKRVAAGGHPLSVAYRDGGAPLLARSVEAAVHVRLDAYAELYLPAVKGVVDDAGGLGLCLPRPVDDKAAKLRLPAGPVTLTGDQATALASTAGDGSLERVHRMQLVFGAVVTSVFSKSSAFHPFAVHALLAEGGAALRVNTGLDRQTVRRITFAVRDAYSPDNAIVSVPLANHAKTKDGAVANWQPRLAGYLFQELGKDAAIDPALFTPAPVPMSPSSVTVSVQNGAGVEGLATTVAEDLRGVGFRISGKPANASQQTAQTVVYYDNAHKDQAETVQTAIPGAQLVKSGTGLRVVVGSDYNGVRQVTKAVRGKSGSDGQPVAVTDRGVCPDD